MEGISRVYVEGKVAHKIVVSTNLVHTGISSHSLGLATAPVLFALERHESVLLPMVERRFSRPGDADRALAVVRADTEALEKTRRTAAVFADRAAAALRGVADSEAKRALLAMAEEATHRKN